MLIANRDNISQLAIQNLFLQHLFQGAIYEAVFGMDEGVAFRVQLFICFGHQYRLAIYILVGANAMVAAAVPPGRGYFFFVIIELGSGNVRLVFCGLKLPGGGIVKPVKIGDVGGAIALGEGNIRLPVKIQVFERKRGVWAYPIIITRYKDGLHIAAIFFFMHLYGVYPATGEPGYIDVTIYLPQPHIFIAAHVYVEGKQCGGVLQNSGFVVYLGIKAPVYRGAGVIQI